MQSYKTYAIPAWAAMKLAGPGTRFLSVFFILIWSGCLGQGLRAQPEGWRGYTTFDHIRMGNDNGFSNRITQYLKIEKRLHGIELQTEFKRWFFTNLGHVFEEAALASYGVSKNQKMFNRRIPDGVEDGILDQITQYTHYYHSTFIEVKCMRSIDLINHPNQNQISDMIEYLSMQENHTTFPRNFISNITRTPGKASEEELAILVFTTPSNCVVSKNVIDFAQSRQVRIYQMEMYFNPISPEEVMLSLPKALTKPSRHMFSHQMTLKSVIMPWKRQLIDPDTDLPVSGY